MPKQRLISQHLWSQYFRDLPAHPTIAVGEVVLGAEEDASGDNDKGAPLLRVSRPKLTRPPAPPRSVADFLLPGWEDPSGKVEVLPSRNVSRFGQTSIEYFPDDPTRVSEFNRWRSQWNDWATAETPVRRAMGVYERLYDLRGKLALQSEQVELILGDGRLRWNRPDGAIDHPVLLQRVELVFDTDLNEFRLLDADRPPELYGPVLGGTGGVVADQMQRLRADLQRVGYHPLAGPPTTAFLKQIAALLGPRASFVDGRPALAASSDAVLGRDPVLMLRVRPPGFAGAFDRVLINLEEQATLPPALTRALGVEYPSPPDGEVQTTTPWTEPLDVLLSKPANKEQVQIARVLERKRTVLVQGPPGTGKSHTIANLIGHLVAQGKRVLVTSHTTKALRVLRDHIVEPLRPLCVSVLENDLEGRAQLEQAVRGIQSRLTTSSEDALVEEVADLAQRRLELTKRIDAVVEDLKTVRLAEYRSIAFGGEAVEPWFAAEWVGLSADTHGWIPGHVEPGGPLPVGREGLASLYALSGQLTRAEELEITGGIPDIDDLMDAEDFAEALQQAAFAEPPLLARFWDREATEDALADLERLDSAVRAMVSEFEALAPWQKAVVAEGHGGGSSAQMWVEFSALVQNAHTLWEASKPVLLKDSVDVVPSGSAEVLRQSISSIRTHLAGGGSLGTFTLLFRPRWKAVVREARVNGAPPATASHFKAIATHLELERSRGSVAARWRRQAEPSGLPQWDVIPKPPEPVLHQYAAQFRALVDWWETRWSALHEAAVAVGLRWEGIRAAAVATGPPQLPFEQDLSLLRGQFQAVVAGRLAAVRQVTALRRLGENETLLKQYSGEIAAALLDAVIAKDPAAYTINLGRLRSVLGKHTLFNRRADLLSRLRPAAGSWAEAVEARSGVHGKDVLPGDPAEAWKWAQLNQELARRKGLDEEELTSRLARLQEDLRLATAALIDRKAWLGQLRRVGLAAQQALNGWAQLQRKIGKGTGKRAPALQAQARKLLSEAQDAVPVWIMPLARVAESVNPTRGRFDVVIIDEASQCDVNGLLTWYLADQVVVVGDNKQVSPMAVGQKLEPVQDLIDQHLQDIPGQQLYDGTLSLYDLAEQSFGGTIGLREHFRCMPDIIEFSNELSYNFEIEPLRNPYAAPRPHILEYVVQGASRDGKTNPDEARSIAGLIYAMVRAPEYSGKTFGAISLLGDEQAHIIWEATAQLVEPAELERRRFVAGNSAQFQGDERDIMLLSLVDSPRDGPLPMRQEEYLKQRYNVAASRARDQLWVVHSLDPGVDLKPGDLRRQLIEYVRSPGARGIAASRAMSRAESPFEQAVIKRLVAAGFGVVSQVKVGSYRIDMVVSGTGGQVAIECDGARFHPPEKIPEDLERQAILERCGWRFLRIRSTKFFADPDTTIAGVIEGLREFGVEPDAHSVDDPPVPSSAIIEDIRRNAWERMRTEGWTPTDVEDTEGEDGSAVPG